MIDIEKALMPNKPDVAQVTAMVNEVMRLYNAALAEVVKDARAAPVENPFGTLPEEAAWKRSYRTRAQIL